MTNTSIPGTNVSISSVTGTITNITSAIPGMNYTKDLEFLKKFKDRYIKEKYAYTEPMYYVALCLAMCSVMLSAFCSGLTVGLLSIDDL